MRGATRPPLGEGPPPAGFGKAPIFPKKVFEGPEAAETLSFPPGLMPQPATDEVLLAEVKDRFYAVMDTAVHPTPGLFHLLDRLRWLVTGHYPV